VNEFINLADFLGLNKENVDEMGNKLDADAQMKQRALLDKVDVQSLLAGDRATADTKDQFTNSAEAKGLQDEASQLGDYLEGLQTGSGAAAGLRTQYKQGASALDGLLAAMRVGQLGAQQTQALGQQARDNMQQGFGTRAMSPLGMPGVEREVGSRRAQQLQAGQQNRQMGFQMTAPSQFQFNPNQNLSLGLNANIWKQTFGDRLARGNDIQRTAIEKAQRAKAAAEPKPRLLGGSYTPIASLAQQRATEAPVKAAAQQSGTTYMQEAQRTPGSVNYGGYRKPKDRW